MANTVEILVEARDNASRAFDTIGKKADSLTDRLRKMRGPLLAIGGGLTGLAAVGIKAASSLNESVNAVNVMFEEGAATVLKFGENSAKAVGLATSEFNQMSAVTGALLKDVGLPMTEVADMTNELAVRAADMASVMDTDVKDAMSAIQQAMRGEAEAIRRFGGDVTQASLQQYALAQGITTAVTEMTEQEKRLLRVGLLLQQTEKFAGDFANTQESFANRTRVLGASMKNLAAEMGTTLLPAVNKLIGAVSKGVDIFASLSPAVKTTIVITGALTAGLAAMLLVLPIVVNGFVALRTAVVASKLAFIAFHATAFFPITLAVIALGAALVTGIVIWKKFGDSIRTIMESAADAVVGFINSIIDKLNSILTVARAVGKIFGKDIGTIPPLVLDVGSAFDTAGDKLNKFKDAASEKLEAVKGLITNTKKEAESLFDEFEFDEQTIAPAKRTTTGVLESLGGAAGISRTSALHEQVRLSTELERMGLGQMASDIISGAAFDGLGTTIIEVNQDLRDAIIEAGKKVVAAVEKGPIPEPTALPSISSMLRPSTPSEIYEEMRGRHWQLIKDPRTYEERLADQLANTAMYSKDDVYQGQAGPRRDWGENIPINIYIDGELVESTTAKKSADEEGL